jgi:hypothetical protein
MKHISRRLGTSAVSCVKIKADKPKQHNKKNYYAVDKIEQIFV